MTRTVYLICDESGAKGYDDRPVTLPGDIGVMAGYLVPENKVGQVESDLNAFLQPLQANGKLHITDLTPEQQGTLREVIFDYLQRTSGGSSNLVYEAIHEAGFHSFGEEVRHWARTALARRRSPISISARLPTELMHAQLFSGVFGKAVAFCMAQFGNNDFHLVCMTDTVDGEILRAFFRSAEELEELSEPHGEDAKGYDKSNQRVVHGKILSAVHGLAATFEGMSYQIELRDNSLTLAADVLANSLHHYLVHRQGALRTGNLNDLQATFGHPLAGNFLAEPSGPESNDLTDALYMHPEERKRLGI